MNKKNWGQAELKKEKNGEEEKVGVGGLHSLILG